ncbi:MAG TPA: hypothetical protein VGN60_07790 [Devosia sp.]|nr:hypothetical protein [Devosia sp.]
MEAIYEQIEELQQAAKQTGSEPMETLFSDAADMALWLLSALEQMRRERDEARTSHQAARENFLTMQGAAAELLKRATAAEARIKRAEEVVRTVADEFDGTVTSAERMRDTARSFLQESGE